MNDENIINITSLLRVRQSIVRYCLFDYAKEG